jgi:hypothetical protein
MLHVKRAIWVPQSPLSFERRKVPHELSEVLEDSAKRLPNMRSCCSRNGVGQRLPHPCPLTGNLQSIEQNGPSGERAKSRQLCHLAP